MEKEETKEKKNYWKSRNRRKKKERGKGGKNKSKKRKKEMKKRNEEKKKSGKEQNDEKTTEKEKKWKLLRLFISETRVRDNKSSSKHANIMLEKNIVTHSWHTLAAPPFFWRNSSTQHTLAVPTHVTTSDLLPLSMWALKPFSEKPCFFRGSKAIPLQDLIKNFSNIDISLIGRLCGPPAVGGTRNFEISHEVKSTPTQEQCSLLFFQVSEPRRPLSTIRRPLLDSSKCRNCLLAKRSAIP